MEESSGDRQRHHEIVSIQIGNYSNYVGGHYFNLQDPNLNPDPNIDPNVFWREGRGRQGKTIWTPRVLIFDLKDNCSSEATTQFLQSISDKSDALDLVSDGILWEGEVKRVNFGQSSAPATSSRNEHREGRRDETNRIQRSTEHQRHGDLEVRRSPPPPAPPAPQSESSQKSRQSRRPPSNQVKSWVDFTPWKLHLPDSASFAVPNFSHNPTAGVLSNYGHGLQIYKALEERVTDSIRIFAEASDYFQGFHILADQCDGFSGLASGIVEHISDEYDKKTSFCTGLSGQSPRVVTGGSEQLGDFMLRTLNTVFCWNSFNLHSSVFTSLGLSSDLFQPNPGPIHLPHINYNSSSPFESSSLLAGALDTLTIPYRVREGGMSLPEVSSLLNAYGHRMTVIGSAFPFPLLNEATLFDTLNKAGLDSVLRSLTPGAPLNLEKNIGNLFVTRGFTDEQVMRRMPEGRERAGADLGITNAQSCLELYTQETCRKSVNVVRNAVSPLKLSHPFPVLFDPRLCEALKKNVVSRHDASAGPGGGWSKIEVWEMPTIASAHNTTSSVGDLLQRMIDSQERAKPLLRGGDFLRQTLDVELDDYDDCINNLRTLRDSYVEAR